MSNPWLERRVLAYAHQGGAREFPSSTRFAIDESLRLGASAIELDVHQSADGVLVIGHDPTVDRTTNGTGAIASLTLAELEGLDAAYWFVPGENAVRDRADDAYILRGRRDNDPRFGIATLDAVLEAYPDVLLNFDIKQSAPEVKPYEDKLAGAFRAHGRTNDVIVTSFNDGSTASFHRLAPEIGTAPGISVLTQVIQAIRVGSAPDVALLEGSVALQVPFRVGPSKLVDERLVEATHGLGLALHVWTVDEAEEMEELVALGVDGIMTDVPSTLVGVLEQAGVSYRTGAGG